jgi:hypothetical protein
LASGAQLVERVSDERVNEGVVGEAHFSQADGSAVVITVEQNDGRAVGLGS